MRASTVIPRARIEDFEAFLVHFEDLKIELDNRVIGLSELRDCIRGFLLQRDARKAPSKGPLGISYRLGRNLCIDKNEIARFDVEGVKGADLFRDVAPLYFFVAVRDYCDHRNHAFIDTASLSFSYEIEPSERVIRYQVDVSYLWVPPIFSNPVVAIAPEGPVAFKAPGSCV